MMKVCHITSVHIPFDTRIFYKECRSLAKAGYEVHLVAKHDRDETIEGIHIHAVPSRKSKIKRMVFTTWNVYKKALHVDAEIYHFHDPELVFIGLLLKIQGKKVICDVHEDYPDFILYKDAIPRLLRRPVAWVTGKIEKYTARFFDAIIVVTPKIYVRFNQFHRNTVKIHNFPILDELAPGIINHSWKSRSDSIIYVGSLTLDRGIKEMIQAVGLVQRKKKVRLVLGGTFTTKSLENHIKGLPEFEFVEYHGFLSRKEMVKIFLKVKAGIVVTHPNPNHKNAYMTKLFEYMSAGIPVIASDFPLWRSIIDEARCGLLVEPMNPEVLADAIIYIIENPEEALEMGKCGRKAVREKYNWDYENIKLLKLYKDLSSIS